MNNLADNLKRIRKENNLSQEQLAEKLGVSRQAVSKWESAQSYPEMDKVLQICSLFDLNINELMNENIKEVNEIKESKKTSNKYITSFFDYLTKVVDMFTSMKLRQIIGCLFEQFIIIIILLIVFGIIGSIGYGIVHSLLINILPFNLYMFFISILEVIFVLAACVFGIAILLHIFKIRYLDYYEFIKVDSKPKSADSEVGEDNYKESKEKVEDTDNNDSENKKKKIVLEKRPETIVIRDPKHSDFKFISGLGKAMLFLVKIFAAWILMLFAMGLVGLVICLSLSFMFVKTGFLFVGFLLVMIGSIAILSVFMSFIYNFIVSKKNKHIAKFIIGMVSLVLVGFGLGLMVIGFSEFDVAIKDVETVKDEYTFEMKDSLMIARYYNNYSVIEYVEEEREDVRVEVEHSKYYISNFDEEGGLIYIYSYIPESESMNMIRMFIKEFNNKNIVDYDDVQNIKVYASKDNIEIMKNNRKTYYDDRDEILDELNQYINKVSKLEIEIDYLESILESDDYVIVRDTNNRIIKIYKETFSDEYYNED